MVKDRRGALVVSLDFELYWGMRDLLQLETYRANLLGVRHAIPLLLELFTGYRIRATWAIVGLLFFANRNELLEGLPCVRPTYANEKLGIDRHLERVGEDEAADPFHFGASLVQLIASYPEQEIGTHTFSHYYCLERGQDREAFRADLAAARKVAERCGVGAESLVFPRNQYNPEYLEVCREMGIKAYRGNQSSWMYAATGTNGQSAARRVLRLADAYLNLTGHNCYPLEKLRGEAPVNIPASRFLRPCSRRLKCLDPLRMKRITDDLTHAATNGLVYHLWWHPHNFGVDLEENVTFLRGILEHFQRLRESYGMQSFTMSGLADRLLAKC